MTNSPPQILLVTMDELTKKALSCCGAEAVETPNLDRLAEQSLNFDNAYAACPPVVPLLLVSIPTIVAVSGSRYFGQEN
jgi:arylsulfatase A-like enzyme